MQGPDGNLVQFKIRRSAPLQKLMSTYCGRAGLSRDHIRFNYNGSRVQDADTADQLEMEDGELTKGKFVKRVITHLQVT